MERLAAEDFDLAVVGFTDANLEGLLAGLSDGAEAEAEGDIPDEDVPETPAVPVSRPGDMWQLGPHRLACGDAGDPEVVGVLMGGERARLCFTSPPYGQQRDYTTGGVGDWDALMRSVFAWLPMAADGQVLWVNLQARWDLYHARLEESEALEAIRPHVAAWMMSAGRPPQRGSRGSSIGTTRSCRTGRVGSIGCEARAGSLCASLCAIRTPSRPTPESARRAIDRLGRCAALVTQSGRPGTYKTSGQG